MADTIKSALADLPKGKNKKQKNKNRKVGRNFKWDGIIHSMTKYRGEGRRAQNKARRAAQRARRLQRRKDKVNGS